MANLEQDAEQLNKFKCRESSDQPRGFHLEHNAVSNEIWEVIQHWLSSNMLPASADEPTNLIQVPIPWETGEQMQGRTIAQFGSCSMITQLTMQYYVINRQRYQYQLISVKFFWKMKTENTIHNA